SAVDIAALPVVHVQKWPRGFPRHPILRGSCDADDVGWPPVHHQHSAGSALAGPEMARERVVGNRDVRRTLTIARIEIASLEQRYTQRLQVVWTDDVEAALKSVTAARRRRLPRQPHRFVPVPSRQ